MKRILILGAMGLELKAMAAALESPRREESPAPCTKGLIAGNEAVLFRCGVGSNSAAGTAEGIAAFAPDLAINAGTAGGLAADLRVGAVVACARIVHSGSKDELRSDVRICKLAAGRGGILGDCLTVGLPLVSPAEKRDAAEKTGCSVCDMEAFHVAAAAAAAGVPFLAMKAVSDSARDTLPDFRRHMDETGVADSRKVALYLASRPDEAARAARFVRSAACAMRELASMLSFVGSL